MSERDDYAYRDLPPPWQPSADFIAYVVLVGLLLAAVASPLLAFVLTARPWP
jgi:hypothetical protein